MSAVWEFFVTHLEGIAFWVSVVAAVAGLIALLVVWQLWSWLEPHYQEHWAKTAVAIFRAIAALSAVAAKPLPLDPQKSPWEQPWAPTIAIAVAGYLLWEIAGARGDQKYKRGKEKTAEAYKKEIADLNQAHAAALSAAQQETLQANQDREDAEFEATRHGWLMTTLRELVGFKRQRIRLVAAQTADARASIGQARSGLGPREQVRNLLEGIATLFRLQAIAEDSERHNQNFRIGLVAERDGRLVPLAAFDLATKSHEPFSSYEQHAERYRLDNSQNPSHAVRCIQEGRALIVADCTAVPEFYFHDRQSNYLRSMVAYPMAGFCPDGVTPARAALVIDTDVAAFFNEDDREMLELLLREFVARIDLEYAISGLTG